MRRRDILLQAASLPVVAALGRTAHAEESAPFDAATVRNLARDLAQRAWQAPDATLPDQLKNLDYQQYRSIRFDPDKVNAWLDELIAVNGGKAA